MINNNQLARWSTISHLKREVDHYEQINSEFKTQFKSYKFEKEYNFSKGGLNGDMHPLKTWFRQDMINWMADWDTPCIMGEMLHAKIVICYTTRSGVPSTVTDHYKFYSDTPLSSKLRLLRWQLILVLGSISNRAVLDECNSELTSISVNLEWYEYPGDVNEIWEIINQDENTSSK